LAFETSSLALRYAIVSEDKRRTKLSSTAGKQADSIPMAGASNSNWTSILEERMEKFKKTTASGGNNEAGRTDEMLST
jgi:hypothetical protein